MTRSQTTAQSERLLCQVTDAWTNTRWLSTHKLHKPQTEDAEYKTEKFITKQDERSWPVLYRAMYASVSPVFIPNS